MAKEIGKDANAQEGAAKAKYNTFRDIYHKIPTRPILHTGMKPISSEHSKIFTADDRRLNERG